MEFAANIPMGFRDFITSRLYRRKIEADFERYHNIQPPSDPTRKYIDRVVRRLLDPKDGRAAHKELLMIGATAAPSLAAALNDPEFQRLSPEGTLHDSPLDLVLGLLVPHAPEQVIAATAPLVRSESARVRKLAAVHLASLGREDTLPALASLLRDADGFVRAYVGIGVGRAIEAGHATPAFRHGMYELLLAQCDQEWHGTLNDAATTVIALDPARAARDFASDRWLSSANPCLHKVLEACNRANIVLPDTLVRAVLEYALPLAVGERCHPHPYVAAAALEALSLRIGEEARPLLESALAHEKDQIQEAAAFGLVRLAGLENPIAFAFKREREVGLSGLTPPQRVVFCGWIFDAEVCNGGIMQFFGNSSGDHAVETLAALRQLEHAEAIAALEIAMKLVGPLAREPERDMRLAAFEDRYDELQQAFDALQRAYYKKAGALRRDILLHAAKHAEHFLCKAR